MFPSWALTSGYPPQAGVPPLRPAPGQRPGNAWATPGSAPTSAMPIGPTRPSRAACSTA